MRNSFGFVPEEEYGINNNGATYFIPIFRDSLISLVDGDAFRIINYDEPGARPTIDCPAFVFLGRDDPFLTHDVAIIELYWMQEFANAQVSILDNANHHFRHHERAVVSSIADWIVAQA
jgi:pimeloyl-ACP methyl ester carboxylesterase